MRRIWNDCDGGVISTELLMVTSVLVAGLASGLTSVRDAVTGEFADVAESVQSLNQGFTFNGIQSPTATSVGSGYVDRYEPVSRPASCVFIDEAQ